MYFVQNGRFFCVQCTIECMYVPCIPLKMSTVGNESFAIHASLPPPPNRGGGLYIPPSPKERGGGEVVSYAADSGIHRITLHPHLFFSSFYQTV